MRIQWLHSSCYVCYKALFIQKYKHKTVPILLLIKSNINICSAPFWKDNATFLYADDIATLHVWCLLVYYMASCATSIIHVWCLLMYYITSCVTPIIHVWCLLVYYMEYIFISWDCILYLIGWFWLNIQPYLMLWHHYGIIINPKLILSQLWCHYKSISNVFTATSHFAHKWNEFIVCVKFVIKINCYDLNKYIETKWMCLSCLCRNIHMCKLI